MTTGDERGWKGRGRESPSPMGVFHDELAGIKKRLGDIESSSGLRSAAISEGDLTIKGGGDVVVRDGGSVRVEGGGSIDTSAPDAFASIGTGGLWLRRLAGETWGQIRAVTRSFGSALWLTPPGGGSLEVLIEAPAAGTVIPKGRVYVDGGSAVELYAEPAATTTATAGVAVDGGAGSVSVTARSPSGTALGSVVVDALGVSLYGLPTTSSPANVQVSTTPGTIGMLSRSTSGQRYKRDIEDLVVDVAHVLALRPRTWRDRLEVEHDPDSKTRYPGFIAEELVDAGLGQFVVFGPDGVPDSIAYDRLTAALVPVLQDQQRQLNELRARIAPTPKETA